jgi:hypothetical protein
MSGEYPTLVSVVPFLPGWLEIYPVQVRSRRVQKCGLKLEQVVQSVIVILGLDSAPDVKPRMLLMRSQDPPGDSCKPGPQK